MEMRFQDLDSNLQKLAQKFEVQAKLLEEEKSQDAVWTSELETGGQQGRASTSCPVPCTCGW